MQNGNGKLILPDGTIHANTSGQTDAAIAGYKARTLADYEEAAKHLVGLSRLLSEGGASQRVCERTAKAAKMMAEVYVARREGVDSKIKKGG